ncbi:MAG: signal peptidase I [Caldilineaceae bacterium]
MNTSDNNSLPNDPDDILDITVQPRSIASSPTSPEPPAEAAPMIVQRAVQAAEAVTTEYGWQSAHPSERVVDDSSFATPLGGDGEQPMRAEGGEIAGGTIRSEELANGELADEGPHWFGVMVREVVETVGLAVIIFLIIRIGIQNYRIEGQSMEPNFHDGEYLIVNKLAYRLGEYERGDVIVFQYPNDPSKDYIKRVIGLPGDTVEIRGGQLFVNGNQIEEPYEHMPNVRDEPPVIVDADHLYVMGDNRPASSDTRSWGQLGQNFVIGQAWLAIYPFNIAGLVKHQPIEVNSVMAQGP